MKILTLFISIIFCSSLSSCSLIQRKKEPEASAPRIKNQLAEIEIDLAAGAKDRARRKLELLIQGNRNSDVADDAAIILGQIYFGDRDYNKAYEAFISVVESDVFSPREVDALLWASRSLFKLGRYDEALSLTGQGIKFKKITMPLKYELYKLRFSILLQFGDRLDALRAVVFLASNAPTVNEKESFRLQAMDIVESRLSDEELETVANNQKFDFVRGFAMFRVAEAYFEQRDFRRAKSYYEDTIRVLPESDIAERSRGVIEQIEARRRVSPKTVGAVLPLSGKHSRVGYRSLRGLQLGLGIYGPSRSSFSLAVVDSEGNPDTARRAVERLVTEDHVIAVVGSLLSRTSVAVASKSNELGVPNVALSQKSGLTEVGEYVFRNALTSEAQVRHLVHMAMDVYGLKRFAILYPNDSYGVEYANLFWDEVLARGGEVRAAQTYAPKETDFRGPIERMVGTYFLNGRKSEYRLLYKDWLKNQPSLKTRRSPPEELLPPVTDFEAIFVPDSTKTLVQVAAMLQVLEVKDVKLLGTNLWNSKSLVRRGQKLVEGSLFVDGLLTSDEKFKNSRFYSSFIEIFGQAPGIFEVQAYDAGLVLRQLIASGERSRIGIRDSLANLQGFTGSIGPLGTANNREFYRPLFALTVTDGQIKPVDENRSKEKPPAQNF